VEKEVEWSEEECRCQQVLRTSEYERYKDRNPDRVRGTCRWFLDHENFQTWHQSNVSRFLWVSADPGCGKSVLSKSLVEDELKSTETRTTCYFFFKDDDVKQKSVANALSALLHQLFSQKRCLIRHAIPDYHNEGYKLPNLFHKLWPIFTRAVTDPRAGEVVCVFDGLDECEELGRREFISALSSFYKNMPEETTFRIKVLATSRPYLEIERQFKKLTANMPTIRLRGEHESETIRDEIDRVIRWRVPKLSSQLDLDDSEQAMLQNELLRIPHRTYLWLKLILDEILTKDELTKKKIKAIINTLPTTIEEAYEAILSKVRDTKKARKLLCIVVAAARPLTIKEMGIALAIEDDHKSSQDLDIQPEARIEATVRNLCGLFLSVVDQKVYLIHQTAKPFLLAKANMSIEIWNHFDLAEAELVIAKTCITYLLFVEFCADWDLGDELEESEFSDWEDELEESEFSDWGDEFEEKRHSRVTVYTDEHHYLGYAASQWANHFQKAQVGAEVEILPSVLDICDTQSQRYRNWFCIYWTLIEHYGRFTYLTSNLMVGSCFGLEAVVYKLLLETNADVEAKDKVYGRTPLSFAAGKGYEAVVKLLLEANADVEAKDKYGGRTPLLFAAGKGHEAVVKLLLEANADVEAEDKYGRTPLSYAAGKGYEAVVKLLLEANADVEAKDRFFGRTPLSLAAEIGYEAVVKLILEAKNKGEEKEENI
jgi:hypothetical protein